MFQINATFDKEDMLAVLPRVIYVLKRRTDLTLIHMDAFPNEINLKVGASVGTVRRISSLMHNIIEVEQVYYSPIEEQ